MLHFARIFTLSILSILLACQNPQSTLPLINSDYQYDRTQWSDYLGGPDRNQYSTLSQITPENVDQLQIAWSYSAPDSGQMQMNPLIANSMVYGVTAALQAFALNAATGEEIWRFGDPYKVWHSTSRGLSYWESGNDKRILYTVGSHLYALNALTGRLIPSFGDSGKVDLHLGLPEIAQKKFIISNTPGTVFEDLIIMPLRLSEGADAAPGDIRAFNIKTGELVWTFHTIPYPGEEGYETWENPYAYKNIGVGGANCWAGMSLDPRTGVLYVPTGSAAVDFYGARRIGANLFANCLIALNAHTGQKIWHYQFTHHDIWDRDPPAPPNLITVKHNGQAIEAVAQITKQGYVFVFDRHSGKPLFDIVEEPVPTSNLPGEQAWPTQPRPVLPKPFARQAYELTEADISPYAENREEILEIFRAADRRLYAPPSDKKDVLLLPGYDGGGEWGGAAADPDKGILYVNSNEMAWILRMQPVEIKHDATQGALLYSTNCEACHQKDFSGSSQSGYPSLVGIAGRIAESQIAQLITNGKGMMPGFPHLSENEQKAILDYISGNDKQEVSGSPSNLTPLPYRLAGYNKFLDSKGLPGISPPWGQLHAIDLNTGKYRWTVPLGEAEEVQEPGDVPTGLESYGGPAITANGLLFIAGTRDAYFRVFDKITGKLLWKTRLPAPAFATPSIYQINGKQYIVLACGGEKLGTPKGNQVIAYSLSK